MKGQISVESDKGWLRLRFRAGGKRYAFALGLPDNKSNRKYADAKARAIELDILSGNFDGTLAKYKPHKVFVEEVIEREESPTLASVVVQFIDFKISHVESVTIAKLKKLRDELVEYFGEEATVDDLTDLQGFVSMLKTKNIPETVKQKIRHLSQIWRWAVEQNIATSDPWHPLIKLIKIPAKPRIKPFSKLEVDAILRGFKQDIPHYHDYAFFLFGTGCRTGEAVGLRWGRVSEDCSWLEISETISRGKRSSTKANKVRAFRLPIEVTEMLLVRKENRVDDLPDSLVFTSVEGSKIDPGNFRKRIWIPLLDRLGIDYRKPYTSRGTFISHALQSGLDPLQTAQITGHDPQVLYDHYLGYIESTPQAPSLFRGGGE